MMKSLENGNYVGKFLQFFYLNVFKGNCLFEAKIITVYFFITCKSKIHDNSITKSMKENVQK